MSSHERQVDYPIKVLQITDTHLFKDSSGKLLGVDTYQSLKDVISLALNNKGTPDFVLLTGDLSQDETAESYRRLKELVHSIPCPKYYLPGNHDVPALMAEVFGQGERDIELDRQFIWGRWQVILLNSTIPGEVGGHLEGQELARLESALAENSGCFTLVCLHHHPLSINSSWIDTISVDNGRELFAVLDRHSNVRAVLWGHIHQQFEGERNGVKLMATPSTCVQFKPRADDFGVDQRPPGCRWIELGEDGSVSSEVMRLARMPAGLNLSSAGY
ncbi:MAG TPA: 3',5'-cyclic-AMP phosphodiesterase [Candidatus Obscuribacterales bacterium]